MNWIREIKWAYQRVRYGYDERIKWGFDEFFELAVKPLKEFCEDAMAETEYINLNPDRKEIYSKTLELIAAKGKMTPADEFKWPNQTSELWKYVGEHIGYYWD